jgi:uncharacterized membrane protein YedE/YeeE
MAGIPVSTPVPVGHTVARPSRWAVLGVLFGVVSAAAIALYGPIGVSTTYPRIIGAVMRAVAPTYAAANPYLTIVGSVVKPETMLVIGLLIGGFLAARIARAHAPEVENVHARETTHARRYVDAFAGGFLILFGARLAGGCTSGHIISGVTQLALSSMLFTATVFAGGMVTARMLKGGH